MWINYDDDYDDYYDDDEYYDDDDEYDDAWLERLYVSVPLSQGIKKVGLLALKLDLNSSLHHMHLYTEVYQSTIQYI